MVYSFLCPRSVSTLLAPEPERNERKEGGEREREREREETSPPTPSPYVRTVYTHCPIVWKVGRRRCGLPIKLDLLRVRSIGSTAAVQIHGNHEIFRAHNPVSFPQTDCCYIFRGNADRRYAPDTLHKIGTMSADVVGRDAICWTARSTRNNRYQRGVWRSIHVGRKERERRKTRR